MKLCRRSVYKYKQNETATAAVYGGRETKNERSATDAGFSFFCDYLYNVVAAKADKICKGANINDKKRDFGEIEERSGDKGLQ